MNPNIFAGPPSKLPEKWKSPEIWVKNEWLVDFLAYYDTPFDSGRFGTIPSSLGLVVQKLRAFKGFDSIWDLPACLASLCVE
jgi:hypothetical protein